MQMRLESMLVASELWRGQVIWLRLAGMIRVEPAVVSMASIIGSSRSDLGV